MAQIPIETPTGSAAKVSAHNASGSAHADIRALIAGVGSGAQPLDADLTAIAALAPADGSLLQRIAGVWNTITTAALKTALALVKSDVGLGNVDNTSDVNKPVSSAQQTALNLKANTSALAAVATSGSATDLTTGILDDARIPSGIARDSEVSAAVAALVNSAPGTLDTLGEIATALQADESAAAALVTTVGGKLAKASNLSDLTNAGTARTNLGLGSVDNTADSAKPVSTATQTALDAKAADLPESASSARTTADGTPNNLLNKTTRYDTTGGAINQPLPAATAGRVFAIGWDAGTAALTLTAAGSDVIGSGAVTSFAVPLAGEVVTYHCTTAGRWRVVSGFKPQSALDGRYLVLSGSGSQRITGGLPEVKTAGGAAISYSPGGSSLTAWDVTMSGPGRLLHFTMADNTVVDSLIALGVDYGNANYPNGLLIANKAQSRGLVVHNQSTVTNAFAYGIYGLQASTAAPHTWLGSATGGAAPLLRLEHSGTTGGELAIDFYSVNAGAYGQINGHSGQLTWNKLVFVAGGLTLASTGEVYNQRGAFRMKKLASAGANLYTDSGAGWVYVDSDGALKYRSPAGTVTQIVAGT